MEIPSEFSENEQSVGFSDDCRLFRTSPAAREMWDYSKNQVNPKDVNPTSTEKYYWKCSHGHSFQRTALSFVYQTQSCPVCFRLKSRVSSKPYLMEYWDFDKNKENPEEISVKSNAIVWWKCPKCGYEWQATVRGRNNNHKSRGKCPACDTGMAIHAGVNDFRTLYPELAKDALDELNPDIDLSKEGAGSHKRINWKCHVCGYEWTAPIYGRIRRENGGWRIAACPVCSGNRRNRPFSEQYPKLAELYSPKNKLPLDDISGSYRKKYFWECPKHGSFEAALSSMIRSINAGNNGCPYCHGTKVKPEESFGALHPELLSEWDDSNDVSPYDVTAGSKVMVAWHCSKGHTWQAPVYNRANGYGDCPVCYPYGKTRKRFSEKHPELRRFYAADNETPFDDHSASDTSMAKWVCEKGHHFEMTFDSVDTYGFHCPVCSGRLIVPGVNDFKALYPAFAPMYDDSRNQLKASEISPKSSDPETWWVCDNGHHFQRAVAIHIRIGGTCPVCAGKIMQTGVNDLLTTYPQIKDIWDYSRNEKRPEDIFNTNHDIWNFKCEKGHHYTATVDQLKSNDFRCLICTNTKLDPAVNSLQAVKPELSKEWADPDVSADDVLCTSGYSALWKCPKCGGTYRWAVNDREVGDDSCPYCRNARLLDGFNDLASVEPQLAEEWDTEANGRGPETILRTARQSAFWICPKCHGQYQFPVYARQPGDDACPYCNQGRVLEGYNDLATTDPELAEEWADDRRPASSVTKDFSYMALWKCPNCGGTYHYPVNQRQIGDDSCPYCNRGSLLSGFNDLKTTDPELAKEWADEKPVETIRKNTSYWAKWRCPVCHGIYSAPVRDREVGDDSCPYCNKGAVLEGFNDLAATDPELAEEWADERSVHTVTKNHTYRAVWKCPTCGGTYHCPVDQRQVGDDACPYCSGKQVRAGVNDLATTDPELAKEWADERPVETMRKSLAYIAQWKCHKCGGLYVYAVNQRQAGDDACPYCSGKRALAGFNDLATTDPELAKEWADERPVESVMKNAFYEARWKCPVCHGIYTASVRDRQVGDDACPYCSGKRVLPGYNSFKVQHPNLMAEWCTAENMLIGVNPDNILSTYREKVWWKCPDCGRKYSMSVHDRVIREKRHFIACTYCRGRREILTHY